MDFPAEIIEIIASCLPPNDQYQGLIVCKSWYPPFCRSLYRHIKFQNRQQLKMWFNCQRYNDNPKYLLVRSIQFGRFGEQQNSSVDCITGAIPLSSIHVGATSNELATLLCKLPLLESMQFDSRLWQYLNVQQLQKSARHNRLLTLPALDHPRQLCFIQSKRGLLMSKLHLRGSDIFKLHKQQQQGMFLSIFQFTPNLTELIVDADSMEDSKHVMSFSIQDMEALHRSLPHLKRLFFIDSVRFIAPNNDGENSDKQQQQQQQQQQIKPTQLTKLELSVLIDKDGISQWLNYFSYKYPQLTDLSLMLSSPYQIPRQHQIAQIENQEKQALASFINKLPRLNRLVIDHSMSKSYLNDFTFSSSNNSNMLKQLQIGLWGDNVETTNKALHCITTNPVTFDSIFHLCIPLWSSDEENAMNFSILSNLHQLAHLEVFDKSGHQQQKQRIATDEKKKSSSGYPIHTIMNSCPYLISLTLNKGQIIATNTILQQQRQQCSRALRSIRMEHVVINETNSLFYYLSATCPDLNNVFLRRCTSDSFDLRLSSLKLTRAVLSELKQHSNQQQLNYLTLHQQHTTYIRLYKSCLHQPSFRPHVRRLNKKTQQYAHIYLECQSVDQLIFNGCRI